MENKWLKEVMLGVLEKFTGPKKELETFETANFLIELCRREPIELMDRIPLGPLVSEFDAIA